MTDEDEADEIDKTELEKVKPKPAAEPAAKEEEQPKKEEEPKTEEEPKQSDAGEQVHAYTLQILSGIRCRILRISYRGDFLQLHVHTKYTLLLQYLLFVCRSTVTVQLLSILMYL